MWLKLNWTFLIKINTDMWKICLGDVGYCLNIKITRLKKAPGCQLLCKVSLNVGLSVLESERLGRTQPSLSTPMLEKCRRSGFLKLFDHLTRTSTLNSLAPLLWFIFGNWAVPLWNLPCGSIFPAGQKNTTHSKSL